jgi:putative polyketide hydroxylase
MIQEREPTPKVLRCDVPVLIVGAGPAGLTTAIALARQGVKSLLVERKHVPSALPRATGVSTRSMELLRSWGLEEEVRAGEVEVEWLAWLCETLASAAAGSALSTGYPTREQSALISPTVPACVPQDHLEPVLLGHLRSLGPARVALGTELASVDCGPERVQALLRDVASGESRSVHARYLVAADGAHSAVRASLGIAMRGPGRLAERVSALFRAPLWRLVDGYRYGLYVVTHPEAAGALIPTGRDDRWLYAAEWDPAREQLADYTQKRLTQLIRLATGVTDLEPRIERIGAVSYAAQLAERFQSGRVFLAGDAAHRVTPRGGTGMNTAIGDGNDLGWKLAWVLRGWAGPELLNSYEAERRPVAEHNTARSADPNIWQRATDQELHVDLGGRIAHIWVPSGAGRVSTLDLLGPGLTLFTGPQQATWEQAAASVPGPLPIAVRSLDAISARAIGIRARGALLARPDGSPTSCWPHDTDAASVLRTAVRSALADTGRRGAAQTDHSAQRSEAA